VNKIFLAGSTGSIGTQALEVIKTDPNEFKIIALSCFKSAERISEQAKLYKPKYIFCPDKNVARDLEAKLPNITIVSDYKDLDDIIKDCDIVLNAIVGFAGLKITLETIKQSKTLALANKESLVAAASLVKSYLDTYKGKIIPVDSEHSALYQLLEGKNRDQIKEIYLTSSGGPFRDWDIEKLKTATIKDALNHPTWNMGAKITVDSSTLMNKGLELIEANALFDISYDQIKVVIQRQSIVHAMVAMKDGSIMCHMSRPDMTLPISYGLYYPRRSPNSFGALDFNTAFQLDFEPPDRSKFKSLDLAYQAGRTGGSAPTWLNAANEVAVEAFLNSKISWISICELIERTMDAYEPIELKEYESVIKADERARSICRGLLKYFTA
jgi:1-deoxy-D-xylulose-5-phosphate reductoisomerase